jgi:hypothetical protein
MNKCTNCDSNETVICPCNDENEDIEDRFNEWAFTCKNFYQDNDYDYCNHKKKADLDKDCQQCLSFLCPRISSFISYLKRKFCNV